MRNRKKINSRTINLYQKGGWKGMSKTNKATAVLSGIGSAAGAVSGGVESEVGNALSGIGGAMSAIPGIGGMIGAGLQVVGQLGNMAFGHKMNNEFVAQTEGAVNDQANYQVGANSVNDFQSELGDITMLDQVKKKDVGKDGWFSKKVANKTKSLNNDITNANNRLLQSFQNRASGINTQTDLNIAANYAAFGGELGTNGTDWTNGINIFGTGGSHEENSNQGIPQGVDEQGVPNLVEEGEVKYKDYIFSNRIMALKNSLEMVGLPLRGEGKTYAQLSKKISKESIERPNDPISMRGLQDSMMKLQAAQEIQKAPETSRQFTKGGKLHKTGQNPNFPNGLGYTNPISFGADIPGSTIYTTSKRDGSPGVSVGSYSVGSPKIKVNTTLPIKPSNKTGQKSNMSKQSTPVIKKSNPSIAESILGTDSRIPVSEKYANPSADIQKIGQSAKAYQATKEVNGGTDTAPTWMRYAPALGGALGALTASMTPVDKPDYSNANAISNARRTVDFTPISQKLAYTPFDRDYYNNKLNAQAGATRRSLENASGGNRATLMAGLLGADYNAQNQMGDLFRQSEEFNRDQKEKVSTFNRTTDQANSQMGLHASMANAQSSLQAASEASRLRQIEQQRFRLDQQAKRDAIGANLTGFFDSMGDIGGENAWRNSLGSLSDAGVLQARLGNNGRVIRAKDGKLKIKI